jgi:hypothetical protein
VLVPECDDNQCAHRLDSLGSSPFGRLFEAGEGECFLHAIMAEGHNEGWCAPSSHISSIGINQLQLYFRRAPMCGERLTVIFTVSSGAGIRGRVEREFSCVPK